MTTYNDSFTGSDNDSLNSYSANWVFVSGDGANYFGIRSNAAGVTFSGSGLINVYRYTSSVGQSQISSGVITNCGSTFDPGIYVLLAVRLNSSTGDHYRLEIQDDAASGSSHSFVLKKVVSGTPSTLASFSSTLSNTDTVSLEVTGSTTTTLVSRKNGTQINSTSDSSSPLTTGGDYVGIGGKKPSGIRLDSWTGGDLSTSPVLSSATAAATGNSTASGTATTTGTDGTMYAVRSAAQPTNAQIVAGQDSTGAASSAGSLAITSAGAKTIPLTGVAVPTGSQTVWFLHRPTAGAASDSNVISATWTQPTAATLSSPTNTPGSTTALVGCTTNTTSGTLYALARVGGAAASASTIVATGQTATVSTTTPSKTYTGLTASTSNYYVDMVQGVGVTTSNVVTTGPFTTSASGDTTPPTLTGSIVIGTVSSTTIQISWSAGSDNVAVTSYEVSKDSGTNWTDVGNVLTYTFTGLTASTSYGLRVRAKDAAGNVSTPALSATQSTSAAGGVGSINLNNAALYVFKKNNATTIASTSVTFWVSDVTTGALVGSAITGLATNASGLVTTAISNASMVAGTTYRLNYEFSSGEYGCVKLPAV